MYIKCNVCGYDVEEEFIGIFANGTGFSTTNGETCCLFGCPVCNTVKFITDAEYIQKRKEAYKLKMKSK